MLDGSYRIFTEKILAFRFFKVSHSNQIILSKLKIEKHNESNFRFLKKPILFVYLNSRVGSGRYILPSPSPSPKPIKKILVKKVVSSYGILT